MIQGRYLESNISRDLKNKMVFLAGPRQVGKTTMAQEIMKTMGDGEYLIWDNSQDRRRMLKAEWPLGETTLILDELHKYRKWKQWIKGEYDKNKKRLHFLVTGSARMDIYRKGGDSLQGRYHHYRLHPFSLAERDSQRRAKPIKPLQQLILSEDLDQTRLDLLFMLSGFPEPFLSRSESVHRRWQKERLERFFREDVRDLENVRDLSSLQILSDILPEKVGAPLSLNSLREDLSVSHRAVSHWIDIFDRLYFSFRLRPYSRKQIRGLKKEPKIYLWDWTLVKDPAIRFENLVASHLLKFCHFLEDNQGYKIELFYLRDVSKREVDFLVTADKKPWFAVEAKFKETSPSPHLRYFGDRLKIPQLYQVIYQPDREFKKGKIQVVSAARFLGSLV
jgi:uncharacterized protein